MGENTLLGLFLLLPLIAAALLRLFVRYHRTRRTPPRWGRVLAGNVLGLLFLLTLLLLGGELYYRFMDNSTDFMSYTKGAKRWWDRYYVVNNALARDNIEYDAAIEPGKRRVIFIGDSFTAGHGIHNVEDRFANRIRKQHPEWEVHVVASPGLNTGGELTLIQGALQDHCEMDQAVLVYNLNDIEDIMPETGTIFEKLAFESKRQNWFERNSYFLSTLSLRWRVAHSPYMGTYFDFVKDGYRGPIWQQQRERLRAMRDMVQSHGASFSVVTFPFMHATGTNYEYQFIHDQLDEFWRELDVPHLDLLPVFRSLSPEKITLNRLDAHPNEYANALAAEQIEPFLVELIRTNPPPKQVRR